MRSIFIVLFISLVIWCPSLKLEAQSFQQMVGHILTLPAGQRQAVVDSFMNANQQFPYTESDTLAHFIFRGTANQVQLAGDMTGWNPAGNNFNGIEGTNFWYLTRIYEPDARLDYKYVINGNNWILDPENPHTCLGGYGPNSELSMPAYVQPGEIQYVVNIPHGSVMDTTFHSTNLNNNRTVRVYLPPGYNNTSDSFPVLLMHDGIEFLNLAYSKNILDNLIASGLIHPLIGVFVPPVNREEEYAGGLKEEFTSFIVDEIIPWADQRFRTVKNPAFRAVAGASNGGNISLWIAMQHPEVFGKSGAFSSNVIDEIQEAFSSGPVLDIDFYLDIGTYDISVLIPMVRDFHEVINEKGYDHLYFEWHEGHSWGNWRAHMDNMLQFFFPLSLSNGNETDACKQLFTCFPNPADLYFEIVIHKPLSLISGISIFDNSGKKVGSINIRENQAKTLYNSSSLLPGTYFLKMDVADNQSPVRVIVVH